MSEKIEPALSEEDWSVLEASAAERGESLAEYLWASQAYPVKSLALANAALPDADPRKITRARLKALAEMLNAADDLAVGVRSGIHEAEEDHAAVARSRSFLAALESYLPPEPPRVQLHSETFIPQPPESP